MGNAAYSMPRYKSGDAFKPSARWLNAVNDLLGDRAGNGPLIRPQDTSVSLRVQNDTGADLPRFSVVTIGEPIVPFATDADVFRNSRVYSGTEPYHGATIGITQEPIADGSVGRADVLGETTCTLNVVDAAHTNAGPGTSTTELTTSEYGPVRILWKEAGTGAGKQAKVLLTGQLPALMSFGQTAAPTGLTVPTGTTRAVLTIHLEPGFYVGGYTVTATDEKLPGGNLGGDHEAIATMAVTSGTATVNIPNATALYRFIGFYEGIDPGNLGELSGPPATAWKGSACQRGSIEVTAAATIELRVANNSLFFQGDRLTVDAARFYWLRLTGTPKPRLLTQLAVGSTVANGAAAGEVLHTDGANVIQSAAAGVRVDNGRLQPLLSAGRWLDFGETSH